MTQPTSKEKLAQELRDWYERGFIHDNSLTESEAQLLCAAIQALGYSADEPGRVSALETALRALIVAVESVDGTAQIDLTDAKRSLQNERLAHEPPVNQCDGCRLGWPLNERGHHVDKLGRPDMACQAQRYSAQPSPTKHVSLCYRDGCNEVRAIGGQFCPAHESAPPPSDDARDAARYRALRDSAYHPAWNDLIELECVGERFDAMADQILASSVPTKIAEQS